MTQKRIRAKEKDAIIQSLKLEHQQYQMTNHYKFFF